MQSADSLDLSRAKLVTINCQNSIPLRHNKQYKCLTFLLMLNIAFFVSHYFLMNKMLSTYFGSMSAGSIFIPFCIVLDDVVTEVYGFRMSMRIFWASMFSLIILHLFFYLLTWISSVNFETQKYYAFTLQETSSIPILLYLYGTAYIANRISSYLLIKWKILLNGKYFWLRSIGSNIPNDILFLCALALFWVRSGIAANLKEAIILVNWSLIFRVFIYLLLAYPSTLVVNLLKIIEGIDSYEVATLNPFIKPKKMEAAT